VEIVEMKCIGGRMEEYTCIFSLITMILSLFGVLQKENVSRSGVRTPSLYFSFSLFYTSRLPLQIFSTCILSLSALEEVFT